MNNVKPKIINLGCRLNIYEGEIIKLHSRKNKLKNVTIINSCAVTGEAEKKDAYEIRKAKKNFPNNKIVVTGGSGRLTIGDGALSPVTDNQIDLGTSSLEFKDGYFDGTLYADAIDLNGTNHRIRKIE